MKPKELLFFIPFMLLGVSAGISAVLSLGRLVLGNGGWAPTDYLTGVLPELVPPLFIIVAFISTLFLFRKYKKTDQDRFLWLGIVFSWPVVIVIIYHYILPLYGF